MCLFCFSYVFVCVLLVDLLLNTIEGQRESRDQDRH